MITVPVLLPYPFKEPFDYLVPPEFSQSSLVAGTPVLVPLNQRKEIGIIWKKHALPAGIAFPIPEQKNSKNLKSILSILPLPILPDSLLQFIDWVAGYNYAEVGSVLAIALRPIRKLMDQPNNTTGWIKSSTLPDNFKLTPARQTVLDFLEQQSRPYTTRELTEQLQVTPAIIQGLAKSQAILRQKLVVTSPFSTPDPNHSPPVLSSDQKEAADFLSNQVTQQKFSVTLLQGITGSGKTEVYMQAIATCLEQGKQILILLPEIALSSQWMERFTQRFGVTPALWHSDLGSKRRSETWKAIAKNQVSVLVGARSALFLPFHELGLIIVDEEHDSSFKQEEGVIYHGRDMAIVRAKLANCPIILVSATPSMETLVNAHNGRYHHLTLMKRHGGAMMPHTELINMRLTPPHKGLFLSPPLVKATQERLARKEQVLLFLNRRGYAPLTLCHACGYRLECPHCSAWLVEHRASHRLVCHHCDYFIPVPKECPHCKAQDSLVPIGPGIERITEEARITFPDARILVMSSDTLTSSKATAEAVRQIMNGEVDLIIGTQLIAKGWHFPDLTLVGVVDADLGLTGADLRAAEKTLQLLHQVGGRAGRAQSPGIVMIQSFLADHPVMESLAQGDFNEFILQEASERKAGFWPPYGRLAAIIVSAETYENALATAQELGQKAPQGNDIMVLGPVPAPLAVLRNRHRQRLLLKTRKNIPIQQVLHTWLSQVKNRKNVKIDVDIDPISFM